MLFLLLYTFVSFIRVKLKENLLYIYLRIFARARCASRPGTRASRTVSRLTSTACTASTQRTQTGPASNNRPSSTSRTFSDSRERQKRLQSRSTRKASRRAKTSWSTLLVCWPTRVLPMCRSGRSLRGIRMSCLRKAKR